MKSNFALFAIALAGLSGVAQATPIVNVNASGSDSTNIWLSAGTYDVSVIGTAQGGMYNGWTMDNEWSESFAMTLGKNTTTYSLKGDPTYASYASASAALSAYEKGMLYTNGGVAANNTSTPDSAVFTLASSGYVDFSVPNMYNCDPSGGVSLSIDPATSNISPSPEPATFGLMGLVLGGGLLAFRRKRTA